MNLPESVVCNSLSACALHLAPFSVRTMNTQPLGLSELSSTRLAYGCWRLADGLAAADARRAVFAAFDAGYTFFDHADIYGRSECERVFGSALREMPGARERVVLATKCGICPPWDGAQHCYDSSAEHIVASVEASLGRLGVESVDILMLHRMDYLAHPDEIARTFTALRDAGKVRHFGLSNASPSQLVAIQRACEFPLIVNQVEISLDALAALDDGTLDQCLAESITPLAWSPLAQGRLLAAPTDARTATLHALLDSLSAKYSTDRPTLALAWLLCHPAAILPIIGTTNPARIREATRACDILLARTDWYALLVAARGARLA